MEAEQYAPALLGVISLLFTFHRMWADRNTLAFWQAL
jgi:hypothetical protein